MLRNLTKIVLVAKGGSKYDQCINPLMNQESHAANVSISINLIKTSRNPVLSFPAVCWLLREFRELSDGCKDAPVSRRVRAELGSPTVR